MSSTETAAQNIAQARLVKSIKIYRHIKHEAMAQAVAACALLSDEEWIAVAEQSGVQTKTIPSADSREIVLALLREEL